MIGKVKRYSHYREYGFITGEDGKDYFLHATQIVHEGYTSLEVGQMVSFDFRYHAKGLQAINVRLVSGDKGKSTSVSGGFASKIEKATDDILIPIKKNPFSPRTPVIDPKRFAGRLIAFKNAIGALYNNENLLITGERGVGKSSLSQQLLNMVRGDLSLLKKHGITLGGYEFNYLTGDFRCLRSSTLSEIAAALIYSLLAGMNKTKRDVETKTTITLNLPFLAIEHERAATIIKTGDLSQQFVLAVEEAIDKMGMPFNGILFLIDEVDTVENSVELAPFLKVVSEKLVSDGYENVSFVVTGITGQIVNMIKTHPSANRLFECCELTKMTDAEVRELIEVTLGGTGVAITQEAIELIISLSDCFPHPVQSLGYYAFAISNDNEIDVPDVEKARDVIVQQIRKDEFEDQVRKASQDIAQDILNAMCFSREKYFSTKDLHERLPKYSIDAIGGTLGSLVDEQILARAHRSRTGSSSFYIREPLFATYLRWVFESSERIVQLR